MKISGWQKIGLTFFLFIFLSVNLGLNLLVKPKETKALVCTCHITSNSAPTEITQTGTQIKHYTFDEIVKTIADACWEEFKIRMINLLTAKVLDFIGASPGDHEKAKFVLDVAEYVWGDQLYGTDIPGIGEDTELIWNALYAYFCNQPTAELTINLFLPRKRDEGFCEVLDETFRMGKIDYTTDEGLDKFYNFLWNFDEVSHQGQTIQAMEAVTTYKERKDARKQLEYLANQGLRDIKKDLKGPGRCLVWDKELRECMDPCLDKNSYEYCLEKCDGIGRCLKWQSTVTVPGAVIEQMSSSAIHSAAQTIADIDIDGPLELGRVIAAVIELVTNSAIDKIISNVEQEGLGLLDKLGEKSRTQKDFYSDFSEYSNQHGFSTSTLNEEAIKWIEYKEQSKKIIEDQIIPTLKKLKKCLIKHNLPATADGQIIDSLLVKYQNQFNQIENQLKEIKDDPEKYDEEIYGSPEEAKNEETELLEKFNYYSSKLAECSAKPTPTINFLSISCDNNNVVTARFAGDIRDKSIVGHRLEIKINDGNWKNISCSRETTCSLPESSCCLTLSQSDKTFQATVRYQGQAGQTYSIRMEVENKNGWSDWATSIQEQCQ